MKLAPLLLAVVFAACTAAKKKAGPSSMPAGMTPEQTREWIEKNAQAAFDELTAEEAAESVKKRPDFAWLLGTWTVRSTALSHGRPYREPHEYTVTASLASDVIVIDDDRGAHLLRASGSGETPRWETWRRGSSERPADCPLTEGWEPATVETSADRRSFTFILPFHPKKQCASEFEFSFRMELRR